MFVSICKHRSACCKQFTCPVKTNVLYRSSSRCIHLHMWDDYLASVNRIIISHRFNPLTRMQQQQPPIRDRHIGPNKEKRSHFCNSGNTILMMAVIFTYYYWHDWAPSTPWWSGERLSAPPPPQSILRTWQAKTEAR